MRSRTSDLRRIPAVDTLLRSAALADALARHPRPLVVEAVRAVLAEARAALRRGGPAPDPAALAGLAAAAADRLARPEIRRVINATGVVLHTNLGRAPLSAAASEAVRAASCGYSSLEFDLESGGRGRRGTGAERWLSRLTGAEAALVVNNGAAALLLALSALAAGRKVVVSRGELVEIGGSFRVPDIMEKSGATLVEVGTTNRTHLADYERALAKHPDVAVVLRVHRSNFRIEGFTARPEARELARLARKRRAVFVEDLGSGALVNLEAFGLEHEPTVAESLAGGAEVVTCSGDKLLGGSQAGLALGARARIERLRKDPFARAFRADKLALAALEATLALYADPARARHEVPALAMLALGADALEARARALAGALERRVPGLACAVVRASGEVGGGSLPLTKLDDRVVEARHAALDARTLETRARAASPPVIGTVRAGAFRIAPRTLLPGEDDELVEALARAWS